MSSPLFIFWGWGTVVSGVLLFRCIVYLHLVQIQGCLPAGPGISLSTPPSLTYAFLLPSLDQESTTRLLFRPRLSCGVSTDPPLSKLTLLCLHLLLATWTTCASFYPGVVKRPAWISPRSSSMAMLGAWEMRIWSEGTKPELPGNLA